MSSPADPGGRPLDGYRTATRGEATKALQRKRRVYAMESFGEWGEVTAIDDLLEQGHPTTACIVRFASGHTRAALNGDFLVERGDGAT